MTAASPAVPVSTPVRALVAAAALAVALVARAGTAAPPPPDFAGLDRLIAQTRALSGLPAGTAVVVVRDGQVIHQAYSGYADIAARTPVSAATVFYIASATKPMFALNALLAEADGRLDTGMSLQSMFPDVAFQGFDAGAVTARDLLTHTAGVDNTGLAWATAYSGVHDAASRRALVAATVGDPAAPRGQFAYTNVGYNLLSVWMEQMPGPSWQDQLARTVFQPLGMRHTSARISTATAGGWQLARPYSLASAQPDVPLYLVKDDTTMQAAGGVVSSAPDLARLLIAELSATGGSGLPRDVIARSQQRQVSLSSRYQDIERNGYAWGWYTGTYKGQTMLHHFGGFAGFHAHLSFMPGRNLGLVVLTNEDVLGARMTALIADHVYGALLGEPDVEARTQARFAALQAQTGQALQAMAGQRASVQARPWTLSQARSRYTGTYANALLGTVAVEESGAQALRLRWGRLDAVASAGTQPDQVRVEFVPNSGQWLEFRMADAQPRAIVFEGMVFDRTP